MQIKKIITYYGCLHLLFFSSLSASAENKDRNAFLFLGNNIAYKTEFQSVFSSDHSPLWLNANKYGASSIKGNNGHLRTGIFRNPDHNNNRKWNIGYGLDLIAAYNYTNSITIQQCYIDLDYNDFRLSVGAKERPLQFKNQALSSGSQTLGINAHPIPEIRIEIPEYISISGKNNWIGLKGHFGYGMMTDGNWQEKYVRAEDHYAKGALYHSKALYLRFGNEERFPLVFESGAEMACQFGGTIYNVSHREGNLIEKIEMGHSIKDFFQAIYGGGNDLTDDIFKNAAGNTLGSWLFSLSYKGKDWKVRAYYDHFFEDHSMMFGEYGWLDGMYGVEFTLPKNRWVNNVVYEFLNTTYQSGPVYHDSNEILPDQISGNDNYYNHNLYQGWQHWGQAIGNPLYLSPLYKNDHSLNFSGNRFKAHHIGIMGQPLPSLSYRILFSHMKNWGTYSKPYEDIKRSSSFLAEFSYDLPHKSNAFTKGWTIKAAFAMDRSKIIGNNTGGMISIQKCGLLTH